MQSTTEYVNLRRYLEFLRVKDGASASKRPEEWAKWLGVFGIIFTGWLHAWFVMAAILVVANWMHFQFMKARLGAKSRKDLVRIVVNARLPMTVRAHLIRGTLVDRIGCHRVDMLDRCAGHSLAIQATAHDLALLEGKTPMVYIGIRNEACKSAERSFLRALTTIRSTLIDHEDANPSDVADLERIEQELSELSSATASFGETIVTSDDQECIERFVARLSRLQEEDDAYYDET